MKKKNLLLGLMLGVGVVFLAPNKVKASLGGKCDVDTTGIGTTVVAYPENTSHTITIDLSSFANDRYKITAEKGSGVEVARSPWFNLGQDITRLCDENNQNCISIKNRQVTWTIAFDWNFKYFGGVGKNIYIDLVSSVSNQCDVGKFELINDNSPECAISLSQERNEKTCYVGGDNSCVEPGDIAVNITGLKKDGALYEGRLKIKIGQEGSGAAVDRFMNVFEPGKAFNTIPANEPGRYSILKVEIPFSIYDFSCPTVSFNVQGFCAEDKCNTNPVEIANADNDDEPWEICSQILNPTKKEKYNQDKQDQYDKCDNCLRENGIWTAIGCIDTSSTESIVGKIMKVGISIAGGIALLMILASAFLFATSEGETKRTSEAKEILTSAIIGLIFIIFSVTILQFIGANILRIPGFGE